MLACCDSWGRKESDTTERLNWTELNWTELNWCWSWSCNTYLATCYKGSTHWKRLWCRERLRTRWEGGDRGWDAWMASSTQWTWAWVSSGSWWWIGKPCMLQSTGLQRVVHNWVTELNWLSLNLLIRILSVSYKFSWKSLAFNFTFPQFINKNPSEVSIKCLYFIYFVYCCCCSTPKLCPTLLRPDGL